LQLATEDIHWKSEKELSITFRRGKGVKARGPYTVHTLVGEWATLIKQWMPSHGPLWPKAHTEYGRTVLGTKVKECLRRGDDSCDVLLEQRSLRRGALQTMAAKGVAEDVLLHFSGHTNSQQLWRYLGWGQYRGDMRVRGVSAAAALWA
jgi:hypothetical protein